MIYLVINFIIYGIMAWYNLVINFIIFGIEEEVCAINLDVVWYLINIPIQWKVKKIVRDVDDNFLAEKV